MIQKTEAGPSGASDPSPESEFKPDKKPRRFAYKRPEDIPRLPGALVESEFYRGWHYLDRIKGLPLVEDTYFLVAHNQDDGNCYWGAIALLIYGRDFYWPWVKAQHYLWLNEVAMNASHPRHLMYHRISSDCSRAAHKENPTPTTAMRGPNSFTSSDMLQVTADLYDIHLVMFSMDLMGKALTKTQIGFQARGSRNATHKFIRWTERNHYEPLRPDVPRPSEYHFPDITFESTKELLWAPTKAQHTGIMHGWRTYGQSKKEGLEVPERLHPRVQIPSPSLADLASTIGFVPGPGAVAIHEPDYLPPISATDILLSSNPIVTILSQSRVYYTAMATNRLFSYCELQKLGVAKGSPREGFIEALLDSDRLTIEKYLNLLGAGSSSGSGPERPIGLGQKVPTSFDKSRATTSVKSIPNTFLTPNTTLHEVSQEIAGGDKCVPSQKDEKKEEQDIYDGWKKGDFRAELMNRGIKTASRDSLSKLRQILEADDKEREEKRKTALRNRLARSGNKLMGGDNEGESLTKSPDGLDDTEKKSQTAKSFINPFLPSDDSGKAEDRKGPKRKRSQ